MKIDDRVRMKGKKMVGTYVRDARTVTHGICPVVRFDFGAEVFIFKPELWEVVPPGEGGRRADDALADPPEDVVHRDRAVGADTSPTSAQAGDR